MIEWAEHMSLKDNSLNFIFSNSVIEHIPPQEEVLKEVKRVLKPGGRFLFTTPSNLFSDYLYLSNKLSQVGLSTLADWYVQQRNKRLNHYHLYSTKQWEKRLAKYGMKIDKSCYCVSKSTLQLWDKMALEVVFRKFFDPLAEDQVYQKYESELKKHLDEKIIDANGADLVICAIKK